MTVLRWWRCWLRRHDRLHMILALGMGFAAAVFAGMVLSGYVFSPDGQVVILACVMVNGLTIGWLVRDAAACRALLAATLREDAVRELTRDASVLRQGSC